MLADMESTLQKIIIFTGAGISVPLGLPSTTDFMDSVKQGWQPVTQHAIQYLGSPSEDIEWLLSTLESFNSEIPFTEFLLPKLANHQQALSHLKSGL